MLTRDQILMAQDISTEIVEVPEWSGAVLVRGLSGIERDRYEATILQMNGTNAHLNLVNVRAKLVALSIVDEDGKRLFDDEDVKILARKSASALQRVFDVAQRLSGLSQSDLQELSKNSGNGQHDGLSID